MSNEPFDLVSQPKAINFQYELALLNEECGEVVQVAGKVLRFGWESTPPNSTFTNLDLLHDEVGDVLAAAEYGAARGMLNAEKIMERKKTKLAFLHSLSTSSPQTLDVSAGINSALKKSTPQNTPQTLTKKQEHIGVGIVVAIILAVSTAFLLTHKPSPEPAAPVAETTTQVEPAPATAAPTASQTAIESAAKDCLQKSKSMGSTGRECDAIVALTKSQ